MHERGIILFLVSLSCQSLNPTLYQTIQLKDESLLIGDFDMPNE